MVCFKDERKSEKSPQWRVSLDEKFIPDKSDKQETAEEEIPFNEVRYEIKTDRL